MSDPPPHRAEPGAARGRAGVLVGSWPLGMPAEPASFYRRLVHAVEGSGYEMLFTGDHLFAAGPSVDSLALLAYFAPLCERLTLGTGVLQLALREPVATAKQVATLDILSGGRMILGLGVGGEFEREWAAAGVARQGRGRRLDEYVTLCQSLWSGDPVEHRGEFRTVEGVVGSPAPARAGGPEIWIGGRSEAALRRAAAHQGWIAYAVSARRLSDSVAYLRELAGEHDTPLRIAMVLFTHVGPTRERARRVLGSILGTRYAQDFDHLVESLCAVGTEDEVASRIAAYRQAGADDIFVCPQCPADEFIDQVLAAEAAALAGT